MRLQPKETASSITSSVTSRHNKALMLHLRQSYLQTGIVILSCKGKRRESFKGKNYFLNFHVIENFHKDRDKTEVSKEIRWILSFI